jgi:hypothetical protein
VKFPGPTRHERRCRDVRGSIMNCRVILTRLFVRARVRALWGLSGWRGNERIGKLEEVRRSFVAGQAMKP